MDRLEQPINRKVSQYYSDKLARHGTSHWGVDWNSTESQELRFQQLCKVLPSDRPFSILDFGCGFGSLHGYLQKHFPHVQHYTGFDIAPAMIRKATEWIGTGKDTQWVTSIADHFRVDYALASGVFNVKLETNEAVWQTHVTDTLQKLNTFSRKGFAFNVLTSYSDPALRKDHLYYADPLLLFDHCKVNYARNVALLHDYDLFEFTLIVKKA